MQPFDEPKPQQFLQRVHETMTWCVLQSEETASLCTGVLQPKVMNGSEDLASGTRRERYLAVETLATARAQLLPRSRSLAHGRLLAYDSDLSLADGAATVATRGFFDCNNAPAWDTWLFYIVEKETVVGKWTPFESYLLSWVPPHLVAQVDSGIWANPEGCICWALDLDTSFMQKLKQGELAL